MQRRSHNGQGCSRTPKMGKHMERGSGLLWWILAAVLPEPRVGFLPSGKLVANLVANPVANLAFPLIPLETMHAQRF